MKNSSHGLSRFSLLQAEYSWVLQPFQVWQGFCCHLLTLLDPVPLLTFLVFREQGWRGQHYKGSLPVHSPQNAPGNGVFPLTTGTLMSLQFTGRQKSLFGLIEEGIVIFHWWIPLHLHTGSYHPCNGSKLGAL